MFKTLSVQLVSNRVGYFIIVQLNNTVNPKAAIKQVGRRFKFWARKLTLHPFEIAKGLGPNGLFVRRNGPTRLSILDNLDILWLRSIHKTSFILGFYNGRSCDSCVTEIKHNSFDSSCVWTEMRWLFCGFVSLFLFL